MHNSHDPTGNRKREPLAIFLDFAKIARIIHRSGVGRNLRPAAPGPRSRRQYYVAQFGARLGHINPVLDRGNAIESPFGDEGNHILPPVGDAAVSTGNNSPNAKLFLRRGIARRWRQEIALGHRAAFFSPYVTGRTARRVLLAAGSGKVVLYTRFLAENFAVGASSINCLRRITQGGVTAYDLPGLHAKMLLIPGRLLTVGSQNLTTGGTQNLEASLLVEDQKLVIQAEKESEEWLEKRVLITPEMIEEMAQKLPKVRRAFKGARDAAFELDDAVEQAQRERDDESRRAEEERRRRESDDQERLRRLQESLNRLPVARRALRSTVGGRPSKESLLKVSSGSFTRWRLDEQIVRLTDLHRYLCVIEETGKLGWARVGSTRISFVERTAIHQRELYFRGFPWTLDVEGVWEDERQSVAGQPRCNLKLTLRKYYDHEVDLYCWFTIGGLEVLKYEWNLPAESKAQREDFRKLVSENEDGIREKISQKLVTPFKYSPGSKLAGTRVFFGSRGRRYVIRLANVAGHPILIARGGWRM
jgi:hypothetical protein